MHQGFNSLVNIELGEQKSFMSYVSWFNLAALEVYNLDHAITMTIMKSKLQRCHFLFSLEKRVLTDFSEMLARVEKYVLTKEANEAHNPPSSLMNRELPLAQESY